MTCSGAPQTPVGVPRRFLGALGVCKIKIQCSEVTIYRACRCLEVSRMVSGRVRDFLKLFLEDLGGSRSSPSHDSSALSVSGRLTSHDLSCLSVSGGFPECSEVMIYSACRCLQCPRELHKCLLEDLGSAWGPSELANARFIGPVGVWEALKSRSVVPVGVWRPPGML